MFIKQFRIAFIPGHNIYHNIVIIIILDFIYKNFDIKILSLPKTGNKTINKIQKIFCFIKAKNLKK